LLWRENGEPIARPVFSRRAGCARCIANMPELDRPFGYRAIPVAADREDSSDGFFKWERWP
jgi:hypothetical protein